MGSRGMGRGMGVIPRSRSMRRVEGMEGSSSMGGIMGMARGGIMGSTEEDNIEARK